jgi:HUS1 checkpoint protein
VESKAENHIYFKAAVANLVRALKSAQNTGEVVIKLAKKSVGGERATPCLTFEINREGAGQVGIVHDVPLGMMTAGDMRNYQEPDMPAPGVEVYLPPIKVFRNVVDRLKNIMSHVTMRATMNGELSFTVDPVSLDAEIVFRNLKTVQHEDAPSENGTAELKVDLRKLAKVLVADRIQSNDVIACFHEDTAPVLHFLSDEMFMSYYIPLVVLDDD